jgi:hypothetical protein
LTPQQIDEITLPQWYAIARAKVDADPSLSGGGILLSSLSGLSPDAAKEMGFRVLGQQK